jgi:prevent-host-death family protein
VETSSSGSDRTDVAIVVAMSITEQMPLAEVKNKLSEVVDNVEREHDRVVITRHGRPAAVVLSVDDLESLEETLEVLSNSGLMADIRDSLASRGDAAAMTKEEALRLAVEG